MAKKKITPKDPQATETQETEEATETQETEEAKETGRKSLMYRYGCRRAARKAGRKTGVYARWSDRNLKDGIVAIEW